MSRLMDSFFEIPGVRWRVGLDAIVGLIPGVGDLLSAGVAIAIVGMAALRYRLPKITLLRMGLNIVIDVVIGAIPFVGDVFDAWWKVNERNIALIRRRTVAMHAGARGATLADWGFVGTILGAVLLLMYGLSVLLWTLLAGLVSLIRF